MSICSLLDRTKELYEQSNKSIEFEIQLLDRLDLLESLIGFHFWVMKEQVRLWGDFQLQKFRGLFGPLDQNPKLDDLLTTVQLILVSSQSNLHVNLLVKYQLKPALFLAHQD